MDGTRSKMVIYQKSNGQLILEALLWLSRNKKDRDNMAGGKTSRATIYNDVLVRMYRRIIDSTEDNKILIKFYDWVKANNQIDYELKQTLLDFLTKEGQKRELLYFISQEDGQKLVNEIFTDH